MFAPNSKCVCVVCGGEAGGGEDVKTHWPPLAASFAYMAKCFGDKAGVSRSQRLD